LLLRPPIMSKFIADPNAIAALGAIKRYELRQGNVAMEMVAGSCIPNMYIFGDADRQIEIADYKNSAMCNANPTDTVGHPVFIVQEESNYCCRACCPGLQPLYAKFYNAGGAPTAGKTCCKLIYEGHQYSKQDGPPLFTLERDGCQVCSCLPCEAGGTGCCRKWLGCFVCTSCCAEDMYIHPGDPAPVTVPENLCGSCCVCNPTEWGGKGAPGKQQPVQGHFARLLMPCGGGGCHPVIDILSVDGGTETPIGVIEGPTCFKGCMELVCDTNFVFSTSKGKSADLGAIVRPKPQDCYNCCRMMCSSVDFYTAEFTDKYAALPPDNKAAILASMIQLDYMFFEDNRPPFDCEQTRDGKGVNVYITMCFWYMCGVQVPCKCSFPIYYQRVLDAMGG